MYVLQRDHHSAGGARLPFRHGPRCAGNTPTLNSTYSTSCTGSGEEVATGSVGRPEYSWCSVPLARVLRSSCCQAGPARIIHE